MQKRAPISPDSRKRNRKWLPDGRRVEHTTSITNIVEVSCVGESLCTNIDNTSVVSSLQGHATTMLEEDDSCLDGEDLIDFSSLVEGADYFLDSDEEERIGVISPPEDSNPENVEQRILLKLFLYSFPRDSKNMYIQPQVRPKPLQENF